MSGQTKLGCELIEGLDRLFPRLPVSVGFDDFAPPFTHRPQQYPYVYGLSTLVGENILKILVVADRTKAEVVLALLKERDLTIAWAAKQIKVSRQSLYNWLNGHREPTDPAVFDKVIALLSTHRGDTSILGPPKIPVGFPTVQMRFAGEVPTGDWGDPLDSEEFVEVESQYEHPKRFAARVVGDSCYPALQPGDLTIWQHDLSPPYQTIVLAQRKGDHGCTVKQLVYDAKEGRNRLVPVNPAHKEPDDGTGWGVIARLIAVIRSNDAPKRTWSWEAGLRPEHLT